MSTSPVESVRTAEKAVAEAPAGQTPSVEAPAAETPAAQTPAETPAGEAPAAKTAAAETPAETPAAEAPAAETPAETPAAEAPAAETPGDSFDDCASEEDFSSLESAEASKEGDEAFLLGPELEADQPSSTSKHATASVMSRVDALMQRAAANAEAAKKHMVEYTISARTMAGAFVEKSRQQTSNFTQPVVVWTSKTLCSARLVTASAEDYVQKTKTFAIKSYQLGFREIIDSVIRELTFLPSYQLGFREVTGDIVHRTTEVARSALTQSQTKAVELGSVAKGVAQDRKLQAAAAGAAVGSAALGAAGGAAGLATGTTVGAAAGLVFAPFTLGLSIPIGAIIGGGSGLMGGLVAGGTAGALSGGAAGVGVYSKRDEINKGTEFVKREVEVGAGFVKSRLSTGTDLVKGKAGEGADFVRGNADACKSFLKGKVSDARMRLVRSGTGGTEAVEASNEN